MKKQNCIQVIHVHDRSVYLCDQITFAGLGLGVKHHSSGASWGWAVCSLSLSTTAVLGGVFGIWVKRGCLDFHVSAHFWAASLLFCLYSCWWREGEKLDVCKSDSVLCKMATFLLLALCRVMIASETLSFIKWVWELLFIKNTCLTGSIFKAYRQ